MNVLRSVTLASALSLAIVAIGASAEPVKLSKSQLDEVVAGAIAQTNGGGHVPGGNANGIPSTNPAGTAPPGQNK